SAEAAYERALAIVTDAWQKLFDRLHAEYLENPDPVIEELLRKQELYEQPLKEVGEAHDSSTTLASIPPPSGESKHVIEGFGVRVEVDPAEGRILSLINERTGHEHEWVDSWNHQP